tara:strand:+ start:13345 stop:14526 length:1182 start_codon:yes stop_codon:yes gene_type:complete
MAQNIPTLNQLYTDILGQLESELGITIPLFGRNFLRALAAVQAAKLKLIYLMIADVQKNIFVDTADPESIGGTLERFGRVKLGRSPFSAQAGTYTVSVTGTALAVIKASTTFKSNDNSTSPSMLFQLDNDYTLTGTGDTIDVRALEGGLDSQLVIGDTLTATAPIANVESLATVTAEVITPLSAETIEDYRTKAIEAYQLEPQGGAATDYRLWSADAQGVAKVYPYVKQGFAGEIELFVEATQIDSIDGKGTPSIAILNDVESVVEFDPDTTKPLNERGRRPVGVFNIDFNPITVKEINVELTGYQNLTPTIQATIDTAVEAFIQTVRPFVDAADVLANKKDILSVNNLTFVILEAVPQSIFTSLDLKVDTVSVPTFTFDNGDIPNFNPLTYV